jgi:hypothetical protein
MPKLKDHLRKALLVLGSAVSVVLCVLGMFVFLWGVDLQRPASRDLWSGFLLCLGPVLSAPSFLILLISPRWHMRFMWLLACASFVMTWAAVLVTRSDTAFSLDEALSAAIVACQPLVMSTFLVAFLVTASHLLRRVQVPVNSGDSKWPFRP